MAYNLWQFVHHKPTIHVTFPENVVKRIPDFDATMDETVRGKMKKQFRKVKGTDKYDEEAFTRGDVMSLFENRFDLQNFAFEEGEVVSTNFYNQAAGSKGQMKLQFITKGVKAVISHWMIPDFVKKWFLNVGLSNDQRTFNRESFEDQWKGPNPNPNPNSNPNPWKVITYRKMAMTSAGSRRRLACHFRSLLVSESSAPTCHRCMVTSLMRTGGVRKRMESPVGQDSTDAIPPWTHHPQ